MFFIDDVVVWCVEYSNKLAESFFYSVCFPKILTVRISLLCYYGLCQW